MACRSSAGQSACLGGCRALGVRRREPAAVRLVALQPRALRLVRHHRVPVLVTALRRPASPPDGRAVLRARHRDRPCLHRHRRGQRCGCRRGCSRLPSARRLRSFAWCTRGTSPPPCSSASARIAAGQALAERALAGALVARRRARRDRRRGAGRARSRPTPRTSRRSTPASCARPKPRRRTSSSSSSALFVTIAVAFLAVRYLEELRLRDRDPGRNPFLAAVNGWIEVGALGRVRLRPRRVHVDVRA